MNRALRLLTSLHLVLAAAAAPASLPVDPAIASRPAVSPLALPDSPPPRGFTNPVSTRWIVCDEIRRRITLLNPEPAVGEPLRLRLEIASDRPDDRMIEFSGRLAYGLDILVDIMPPSGRAYKYEPFRTGQVAQTTVFQVSRSSPVRLDFSLVHDPDSVSGAAFDTPGTYRIAIGLRCYSQGGADLGVQQLDVLTFNVVEGSEDDKKVFSAMRGDIRLWRLLAFSGRNATPEQIERLMRLADDAPTSGLSPYLLLAAANALAQRSGTIAQAEEPLTRLITRHPSHPVREDAEVRRLAILEQQSRRDETFSQFARLWQHPAMTHRMVPRTLSVQRYAGRVEDRTAGPDWSLQEQPNNQPLPIGLIEMPEIAMPIEVEFNLLGFFPAPQSYLNQIRQMKAAGRERQRVQSEAAINPPSLATTEDP